MYLSVVWSSFHLAMEEILYPVCPFKTGPVESRFVLSGEDTPMYAVIRSGGKQYRVTPGETIRLEKVAGENGVKG